MISSDRTLAEQLYDARSKGGVFQVPSRLTVRLAGKDAFRYLHGQVTRDLNRLKSEEAISACILTPKGKLCAPLLIRREADDMLVETDSSLEESLLARLERYIVADEVVISIEQSPKALHCFGAISAGHEGICVSRLGVPGVDLKSDYQCKLIDARVIETLRIERGIPVWGHEMNEETLPPEVGLDQTHIDYDRGCYPGQETISRLKSIGRVRRLLHTLRSSAGNPLQVGMRILDQKNDEIGIITSASEQFDLGCWVALAVLPREITGPIFASDSSVPLTREATPITISEIHGS